MRKTTAARRGGAGSAPSGGKAGGKRRLYVALTVLLIAGVATLSYLATRPPQGVTQVDTTLPALTAQGHVMGSDTALVEVIEFADFECPACGRFATLAEPDVRVRLVNTGLIRFRFMDFPLDIHRNTWPAHNAAWCASEQGKFWQMHDAIFQTQDRWSGGATRRPESVLEGVARQVGLDMRQYERCMASRKFEPQIRANYNEAVRRGIPSTPTFIIGTRQIPGAIAYDEFKRHVDDALAQARAGRSAQPSRSDTQRSGATKRGS